MSCSMLVPGMNGTVQSVLKLCSLLIWQRLMSACHNQLFAIVYALQVTQHLDVASLPSAPEDGIYINGLWIDGARWNMSQGCLEESEPGVMYAPLPIVHFQPMQDYVMPKDQYECPLYKTSARAGVLSTTGQSTNFVLCVSLPVKPGTDSDVWVLQGVALLCMLKD